MNLPFLTPSGKYDPVRAIGQKQERTVGQWGGLDERLIIDESSFSAMKNMSTRFFPAVSTRLPRGTALQTIANPHGLYWKNHLFWISGTKCFYDDSEISGMTVTDGDKQIVGMGAYICVFPDKKVFNTATGEVNAVDATYDQNGTITFEELSQDSAFCKITATGIQNSFKLHDGVTIYGVNDKAFLVDGQPATKVVSETGTNYIVVSAVIQNAWTGKVTMTSSSGRTRIAGTGIHDNFSANDTVKVIGCKDDALNVTGKAVQTEGTGYIEVNQAFPAKSFTQSGTATFSAYFTGSNLTRIYCASMGDMFSEGDVVTIAGCTNPAYNGSKTVRQAGTGYILVDGTLAADFTQQSGLTINRTAFEQAGVTVKRTSFTRASGVQFKRESQPFDYVCEHDNRLWACSSLNHEIYASKLGDPTNWQAYEGISTDSYTVTVGSDGDFTGCCSHGGYVLFFKEDAIHMMYGNKPANFQLNTERMPGVRKGSNRSLCVVNETLYYVGRQGVYRFDGATPTKISDQITAEISEGVGSQQDGKYYLSCLKNGNRELLVFDPKYQTWHHEDDTQFKFASYGNGVLYYIDSANALRTITGDSDDIIEWSIESGDLRENSLDQKWISKAKFSFWLEPGAEANIFFQFDEDLLWHRAGTVHSVTAKTYTIPIIPQRCSRFRWKIEGKGQMKLLAMGITVEGGSEINGSIQSAFRR